MSLLMAKGLKNKDLGLLKQDDESSSKAEGSSRIEQDSKASTKPVFDAQNIPEREKDLPEEVIKQSRKQFNDLLKSISDDEKQAYLEVLNEAPYLIDLESPPLRFLRHARFDIWTAVNKFVAYWQHRKFVFGDRFCLPLSQDGDGALSKDDLEVFRTGHVVLLPEDKEGRAVIFYDRSKLEADFYDLNAIRDSRLRALYYVYSLASENDIACTRGVRVLCFFNSGFKALGVDSDFISEVRAHILSHLPMTIVRLDLCFRSPREGRKIFVENCVPPMVKLISATVNRTLPNVHAGKAKGKLLQDLLDSGVLLDGLPKELGGNWGHHEQFSKWRRERTVLERAQHAASRSRGSDPMGGLLSAAEIMQEELEKKRRRDLDALYARRKRAKQRIEVEVLQNQVHELSSLNSRVSQANKALERLVTQAHAVVNEVENSRVGHIDNSQGSLDQLLGRYPNILQNNHLDSANLLAQINSVPASNPPAPSFGSSLSNFLSNFIGGSARNTETFAGASTPAALMNFSRESVSAQSIDPNLYQRLALLQAMETGAPLSISAQHVNDRFSGINRENLLLQELLLQRQAAQNIMTRSLLTSNAGQVGSTNNNDTGYHQDSANLQDSALNGLLHFHYM